MSSSPIELSDQLLMETGGWKEMKEARLIHKAGKVANASYENGMLEGMVLYSGKNLRVKMMVRSRTDFENMCPCFRSKRDGIICSHALAVGLQVLAPVEKSDLASPANQTTPAQEKKPLSPDWPRLVEIADQDTIPAQFHIILSPDIASAWQKKSMLLGIEVESDGTRRMLGSTKGQSLFVDPRDAAFLRYLQSLTPEKVPSSLNLPRNEFLRLLGNIPGHSRVQLGKKTAVEISLLPHRPSLELRGEKIKVNWDVDAIPLIGEDRAWVLLKNRFYPVAPGLPQNLVGVFAEGSKLDAAWMAQHADSLGNWFELDDDILDNLPTVRNPQILLQLEGSLNHQDAKLFFQYGETTVPASIREAQFVDGGVSNVDQEKNAIEVLEDFGFRAKGIGSWILKDKNQILRFLAHGYPSLDPNWIISIGDRFEHALTQVEPVRTEFDFQASGENWFVMDVGFSTDSGGEIGRTEIQRLLQMGQSSQKLTNGKTAVIDSSFLEQIQETVADVDPQQDSPGIYTIDRSQAGYLLETAKASGIGMRGETPWLPEFEFEEISPELQQVLRPYQKEGVEWMLDLAGRGMGGILADDMGLGKTLQTLTLIHTVGGSALVVCPSSLVSNWVAEAEKFVPDLKAVAIEGPSRDDVYEANVDASIFVTSYALLRLDEKKWKDRGEFTIVVLDEAQHIKNPDAKVTKAALRLPGTYRFALSGTPLENSVRDLWSIGQFVIPGYLGNRATFTERIEKPIAKGDRSTQSRLRRRLQPILLRRLKSEVARDLPEKIEQVVYCDLKPKQQAIYQQILRQTRESIVEADGGRKRMMALTALLRLRQTCCDLRLLNLPDLDEKEASVKVEALEELVTEAIEGNHRVLVFSQFVQMLQILVPMLGERGVKYCYLDGSTRNRGDVVRKFQEDDSITVFLISLKAGGVGLNLTGADTVIHVDPWWNPAVEAQATDRAHRIGQTRVVTSYKLITRNTVEEKILALQNKKREAIRSIIDNPEADLGESGLSEEELMELLEG